MTKTLAVDLLRIDAGTQNRLKINEETVEDYAELIAESNGKWPFEPLDVFHDGTDYFVADGFHRTLAAQRAKRSSVPCEVHKGTARDARIFGMTANDRHGLRMSRADKRACVEWLLDNEPKLTQADIAEKSGVSLRSVKRIVADRKPSVLGQKGPMSPNFQGAVVGGSSPAGTRVKPDSPAESKDARPDDSISAKGKPGGVPPSSSKAPPASSGPASDEAADLSSDKLGKCPNCGSVKWKRDDFGCCVCAKCKHPHGEPRGDADEDRAKTQAQKTVKTAEALMRAFDDLNQLLPKPDQHTEAIASCKFLLKTARAWK